MLRGCFGIILRWYGIIVAGRFMRLPYVELTIRLRRRKEHLYEQWDSHSSGRTMRARTIEGEVHATGRRARLRQQATKITQQHQQWLPHQMHQPSPLDYSSSLYHHATDPGVAAPSPCPTTDAYAGIRSDFCLLVHSYYSCHRLKVRACGCAACVCVLTIQYKLYIIL